MHRWIGLEIGWESAFVEDDVMVAVLVDMEVRVGQSLFGIVSGHVVMAVEEHGVETGIEYLIASGVEEPGDAVVAPWGAHLEVSSAQCDWGLKEPGVLRYARILVVDFFVPNGMVISDFVARATGYLIR